MRALVFVLLAAVTTPQLANADPDDKPKTSEKKKDKKDKKDKAAAKDKDKPAEKPAPEPRKPGPSDAKVVAAAEKIVAATDRNAREKAIADFAKVAPEAPEAIGEWVAREHTSDLAERRKVLTEIKASTPGKGLGQWVTPPRKDKKGDDDLDWQKELLDLDQGMAGIGEVIADVAAIRALSATKDVRAGQIIFDVGFAEQASIYRDECGRYLRKMEAAAIPALTRESQGRNEERKRYATWQLERMDRQDATKALSAAVGNEPVQIAVLDVFRETKHREAVNAVWAYVDNPAPRIREAARAAWMAYIVGPPPPPAPRQHLKLAGGKLTRYPKPLWLTYRELADTILRKAANELLHEDYVIEEQAVDDYVKESKAQPIDLEDVTKRLFAYYDSERTKKETTQWQAAKAKADGGDLAAAAGMIDRLVATNPERAERVEMAKVYVAYGKQLESTQKWSEASAAFSKAYGLDAQKPTLAAHYYTLGKFLESQGKDGGPDFRRAIANDPEYAPAKQAAESSPSASEAKPVWMLYAAVGAGGIAMLLFAAAMMRRRAA